MHLCFRQSFKSSCKNSCFSKQHGLVFTFYTQFLLFFACFCRCFAQFARWQRIFANSFSAASSACLLVQKFCNKQPLLSASTQANTSDENKPRKQHQNISRTSAEDCCLWKSYDLLLQLCVAGRWKSWIYFCTCVSGIARNSLQLVSANETELTSFYTQVFVAFCKIR